MLAALPAWPGVVLPCRVRLFHVLALWWWPAWSAAAYLAADNLVKYKTVAWCNLCSGLPEPALPDWPVRALYIFHGSPFRTVPCQAPGILLCACRVGKLRGFPLPVLHFLHAHVPAWQFLPVPFPAWQFPPGQPGLILSCRLPDVLFDRACVWTPGIPCDLPLRKPVPSGKVPGACHYHPRMFFLQSSGQSLFGLKFVYVRRRGFLRYFRWCRAGHNGMRCSRQNCCSSNSRDIPNNRRRRIQSRTRNRMGARTRYGNRQGIHNGNRPRMIRDKSQTMGYASGNDARKDCRNGWHSIPQSRRGTG